MTDEQNERLRWIRERQQKQPAADIAFLLSLVTERRRCRVCGEPEGVPFSRPVSRRCDDCFRTQKQQINDASRRRQKQKIDRVAILTDAQARTDWHQRFWTKVDKTPGHGPNGDCWIFGPQSKRQNEYGKFNFGQIVLGTHVVSYGITTGKLIIPFELKVLHSCDNRRCVNPAHLRLGTNRDNSIDSQVRGRHAAGERHACAQLTFAQAQEIRETYRSTKTTQQKLAQQYGVCNTTISDIIRGRRWHEQHPRQ